MDGSEWVSRMEEFWTPHPAFARYALHFVPGNILGDRMRTSAPSAHPGAAFTKYPTWTVALASVQFIKRKPYALVPVGPKVVKSILKPHQSPAEPSLASVVHNVVAGPIEAILNSGGNHLGDRFHDQIWLETGDKPGFREPEFVKALPQRPRSIFTTSSPSPVSAPLASSLPMPPKQQRTHRGTRKGSRKGSRKASNRGGYRQRGRGRTRGRPNPRPTRTPKPKARAGRVSEFSDYIPMPRIVANGNTQAYGDCAITPAFPQGICVAAIDINPLVLSQTSMLRTESNTWRRFRARKLKAHFCPYEFPGANATLTGGQYAFVWDDNPDSRFAVVGQVLPMDTILAHDGVVVTKTLLGETIVPCHKADLGDMKSFHVMPGVDPSFHIQTTLYVFQTAGTLSTGASGSLPFAKLYIKGQCHFSERTLTPQQGSMDVAATNVYSTTNWLAADTVATAPAAGTLAQMPPFSKCVGYNVNSNLGVGLGYFPAGAAYYMSFPYAGNYCVNLLTAISAGTPSATGSLVNVASVSAASVQDNTSMSSGPFINGQATGSGTYGETIFINTSVPNQIIYILFFTRGMTYLTAALCVTYQATGFSASGLGGLGDFPTFDRSGRKPMADTAAAIAAAVRSALDDERRERHRVALVGGPHGLEEVRVFTHEDGRAFNSRGEEEKVLAWRGEAKDVPPPRDRAHRAQLVGERFLLLNDPNRLRTSTRAVSDAPARAASLK